MIFFKCIRWRNLLSTGNTFTEVFLDKSPMTLVIGINGSGKSTLADALTFALFGKPFRNLPISLIVNSINEKELLVEVEFRIGTKEYKIERGVKPSVFNIYCNGVKINQDAAKKDYQKVLENQILKFNYKAFTQIVILGSSSFTPFMQLPALDRRVIIEDLLDIEIFSSMNAIIKLRLKDIVGLLEDSRIELDSTISKIELQKKYVEEAKKNNNEVLKEKRREYQENADLNNTLVLDARRIQNYIDGLLKEVEDEGDVKVRINKLRGYQSKIESKMSSITKHRDFYIDNLNCPTCGQGIDNEYKSQAVQTANNQITEYHSGLLSLEEELTDTSIRLGKIHEIQKKIQEHQSEIVRINASVSHIRKHIDKLESEIKELENKKVLSDDMLQVSEQLMKDLTELNETQVDLTESKKYYDVAATLLKDNGIKTKIIKQYLPVINKLVNKYLAAMDQFINFNIDEEFHETIKSRYRDSFRYESFSEGEKMRIDLALLFTWRMVAKLKNSMDTNVLILDEVFDSSLDTAGTEEFMKLLNSLGIETNVFVISHKGDILVDKFKHVIKFEKKQNFSVIV